MRVIRGSSGESWNYGAGRAYLIIPDPGECEFETPRFIHAQTLLPVPNIIPGVNGCDSLHALQARGTLCTDAELVRAILMRYCHPELRLPEGL